MYNFQFDEINSFLWALALRQPLGKVSKRIVLLWVEFGGLQLHKMLALTADWAFVLALKGTALEADFGSEQCLMFCGDCGVKDGDCQGKSNYVGQIEDSVVPILGEIF